MRFAALAALVVAAHIAALRWLADELQSPAQLKPMATPMFTRMLQPEAPAIVAQAELAPKPMKRRRAAITAVKAPVAAQPASSAASAAQAQASAPQPEVAASAPATAAADAPDASASAPVAAASAPEAPASAAVVIAPDTWPADTRLSYRVSGYWNGDITGSARVQWLRDGDRYEARIDLDFGILALQFLSQGVVAGESLAPNAYQESWLGRVRSLRLGADSVTLNDGRLVPRPPGAQDTASQLVELSHRFSTGREKLVVGGVTSFWLARPGGVNLWTYDIIGVDRLQTRHFGPIDAYHLKPRPIKDARGDIYSEIWIAPSLQYLPVRIKLTQGPQTYVDVLVDRIEQR